MSKLKILMARYEETGRIATHYPRLKKVSLNGFRSISETEAIKQMQDFFTHSPPTERE